MTLPVRPWRELAYYDPATLERLCYHPFLYTIVLDYSCSSDRDKYMTRMYFYKRMITNKGMSPKKILPSSSSLPHSYSLPHKTPCLQLDWPQKSDEVIFIGNCLGICKPRRKDCITSQFNKCFQIFWNLFYTFPLRSTGDTQPPFHCRSTQPKLGTENFQPSDFQITSSFPAHPSSRV